MALGSVYGKVQYLNKNEYVQNMVAKIKGLNFTIGAVEFGPGNCVDRVFLSSEINQRGQWFQLIFFPGSSKLEVSNRVVAQGGCFKEPAKCLWKNVIDCSFNGALFNFYEVVVRCNLQNQSISQQNAFQQPVSQGGDVFKFEQVREYGSVKYLLTIASQLQEKPKLTSLHQSLILQKISDLKSEEKVKKESMQNARGYRDIVLTSDENEIVGARSLCVEVDMSLEIEKVKRFFSETYSIDSRYRNKIIDELDPYNLSSTIEGLEQLYRSFNSKYTS